MKTPSLLSRLIYLRCALAVALLTGGAAAARANVEFSTMGDPANVYATTSTGASIFGGQAVANRFTASFSGQLTSVQVAAYFYSAFGGNGNFDVRLGVNDPATNLPMKTGWTNLGTLTAPPGGGSSPSSNRGALLTLASTVPYALNAGESYWLAVSAKDSASNVVWNFVNNPNVAPAASSYDGGNTFASANSGASGFRVEALPMDIAVPEGGTNAAIIGLMLTGLLVARRVLGKNGRGLTQSTP